MTVLTVTARLPGERSPAHCGRQTAMLRAAASSGPRDSTHSRLVPMITCIAPLGSVSVI